MNQLIADVTLFDPNTQNGITGLGPFEPSFSGSEASNAASQLSNLISVAIGTITIVAGLAFLLYFIMGALGWLTSGGDKQKLDNSRDRITTALIGLVLVIAAYAIVGVVGTLFGLNILDLRQSFCQLSNDPQSCLNVPNNFTR